MLRSDYSFTVSGLRCILALIRHFCTSSFPFLIVGTVAGQTCRARHILQYLRFHCITRCCLTHLQSAHLTVLLFVWLGVARRTALLVKMWIIWVVNHLKLLLVFCLDISEKNGLTPYYLKLKLFFIFSTSKCF